jgi:pimeloyl-ACP methyl ester carboxylesterase
VKAAAPALVLVGYSFGGLMALKAIARGERVLRAAAIGLPTVVLPRPAGLDDLRTALGAVPTLLVSGTRDQFCETEVLGELAATSPSTRLRILDGVGHFPDGADRATVIDEVLRFVTGD